MHLSVVCVWLVRCWCGRQTLTDTATPNWWRRTELDLSMNTRQCHPPLNTSHHGVSHPPVRSYRQTHTPGCRYTLTQWTRSSHPAVLPTIEQIPQRQPMTSHAQVSHVHVYTSTLMPVLLAGAQIVRGEQDLATVIDNNLTDHMIYW